jgi:hypothetical protein
MCNLVSWVTILILTKPIEKGKKEKEMERLNKDRREEKRKKTPNNKRMGEMVDDQTTNQAAIP